MEDAQDGAYSAKERREPDARMHHMIEVMRVTWKAFIEEYVLTGSTTEGREAGAMDAEGSTQKQIRQRKTAITVEAAAELIAHDRG